MNPPQDGGSIGPMLAFFFREGREGKGEAFLYYCFVINGSSMAVYFAPPWCSNFCKGREGKLGVRIFVYWRLFTLTMFQDDSE